MNKTAIAKTLVIQVLLEAGFVPDGETRVSEVRIPTVDTPCFGSKSGGKIAQFGGRVRFARPGTNIKATVGDRTTTLYCVEGKGIDGVRGIAVCRTRDLVAIKTAIESVLAHG
ncbi:MAG: hypothetical protein ACYDHY_18390 [Acidiferrobacterales bacterium]